MILLDDVVFLTDLYEFSMAYTYFKENKHEQIVYFDMFTRKIPDSGGYMIFNGLTRLIEGIKHFKFHDRQLRMERLYLRMNLWSRSVVRLLKRS